jgi:hypothetical protein
MMFDDQTKEGIEVAGRMIMLMHNWISISAIHAIKQYRPNEKTVSTFFYCCHEQIAILDIPQEVNQESIAELSKNLDDLEKIISQHMGGHAPKKGDMH